MPVLAGAAWCSNAIIFQDPSTPLTQLSASRHADKVPDSCHQPHRRALRRLLRAGWRRQSPQFSHAGIAERAVVQRDSAILRRSDACPASEPAQILSRPVRTAGARETGSGIHAGSLDSSAPGIRQLQLHSDDTNDNDNTVQQFQPIAW